MLGPRLSKWLHCGGFIAGLCGAGSLACSSAPKSLAEVTGAGGFAGAGGGASSAGGGPGGGDGGTSSGVDCSFTGSLTISVPWNAINSQSESWYTTVEALALANNILYYQNADGGWPKEIDMRQTSEPQQGSTIDNSATTTQIKYLARVFSASACERYGQGAIKGIEHLLSSQYPESGGWPQEYPEPEGYHAHITYNDNAMVRVLELLRELSNKNAPYGFADDALAGRAGTAVTNGISCILNTQVVTSGERTSWCAQHDAVTLEPALARTYELPSLSGSESVGIVRFLMSIDQPSAEVKAAIEGAVAWFEAVKITGIRIEETVEDRVVVEDPAAPPLWARFYELGTNVPIFSSRCEVDQCETDPFFMRRYSLAEIDIERRVGYAWYGNWPASILNTEYPAWKAKWPAE